MHSVHKAVPGTAIGAAVIITCLGQREDVPFGEFHILFPERPHQSLSLRFTNNARDLSEQDLQSQMLDFARDRLQNHVDEFYLKSGVTFGLAPSISLVGDGDATLRTLRYHGRCQKELSAIASRTWSTELKDLLNSLKSLPVIS